MSEPSSLPPTPTQPAPRSALRVSLILGIVALPLGLWLLLESMGVAVPEMSRYWPTFLVLVALGLAIDFFALSRRPRSAGLAVFYLGMGLLFFGFTLGQNSFAHFLDRLPALPLIIGASLLATWFTAGMRDGSLLVAGLVFGILGLAGFAARFEVLRNILPRIQEVWAIGLLVVGAFLIWRVVQHARSQSS